MPSSTMASNKCMHQTGRVGAAASRPVVEARPAGDARCSTGRGPAAVFAGFLISLLLAIPSDSYACACASTWPTIEQASRKSDVALIGRVLLQAERRPDMPSGSPDVPYVDVRVLTAIKGLKGGATIRIWDWSFGTDCSVDLRPLKAGTVVAVALGRNRPDYAEFQKVMGLKVAAEDYLLPACGEYSRVLRSEEEGQELAARIKGNAKDNR